MQETISRHNEMQMDSRYMHVYSRLAVILWMNSNHVHVVQCWQH
jgi:hypothetical protein